MREFSGCRAGYIGGDKRDFTLTNLEAVTAMANTIDRRDFLRLAGIGGAVFASGLAGCATMAGRQDDFYFVQLSDTHWGFKVTAASGLGGP